MKLTQYIILFLAALTSACASKPNIYSPVSDQVQNGVKLMPAAESSELEILNFYDLYSNLSPETQKQWYIETNQALAINKNDLSQRIKLATMLSAPNSRLRDSAKAQSLLQDIIRESSLNKFQTAYLGLLYDFTLDSVKQQQKIREENKSADVLQQKNDALTQKNDLLQKKNNELEHKLTELKNIEKTISDRDLKPTEKTTP